MKRINKILVVALALVITLTIEAGDRTIDGMEFAYSSEDGTKTIEAGTISS